MKTFSRKIFISLITFVILIPAIVRAITRDQIINDAQIYINITNWSPGTDLEDFGLGSDYLYTSTYRTFANGGYTYIYPNYPIGPYQQIVGPPNPIVAYVFGGSDDPSAFLSRINNNVCAGGYNTSVWYLPVSKGGYGLDYLVPQNLAGIDCSGFVTNCWGMTGHPYSTSTIENICIAVQDSQLKKGDILNNPGSHVVLYVQGDPRTNPIIYESASSSRLPLLPPGVMLRSCGTDYNNYRAYSIFPQFLGMYPPPDTTLSISEDVVIELLAEGTKPSPKNNVVAEIKNVKMWLDESLVKPSVTGAKNIKTIKYKPNNLQSGEHYVKVQCENVVNGIAYEDTIVWRFHYGKSGWYNCFDNIYGKDAYWLVMDNTTAYELYREVPVVWNWTANFEGVDLLKTLRLVGIYDLPRWATTTNDTFNYLEDQPRIDPISTGGYNIAIDGKVVSGIVGEHLYTPNNYGYYWNRVLCRPTELYDLEIVNPKNVSISYIPPAWPQKIDSTIIFLNTTGVLIGEPQLVGFSADSIRILWGEDVKTKPNVSIAMDDKVYTKEIGRHRVSSTNILKQNFPNPVISSTNIKYSIETETKVTLKIYNLAGQLVKTLVNGQMPGGIYAQFWDGTDENNQKVSQGVYLYRMTAGNYSDTKKLIILR